MRRSAGLPLSVGGAPLSVRLVIAFVFLLTSAVVLAGAVLLAPSVRVVAVALIAPLGVIGLIATAFIVAPHSRFGVWLDHFVPRLREPWIAVATAIAIWAVSFAIVALAESLLR